MLLSVKGILKEVALCPGSVCSSLFLLLWLLQQCCGSVWEFRAILSHYSQSILWYTTSLAWVQDHLPPVIPAVVTTDCWLVPTIALWLFCIPTTICSSLTPQTHSALEMPGAFMLSHSVVVPLANLWTVARSGFSTLSQDAPWLPRDWISSGRAIQWISHHPSVTIIPSQQGWKPNLGQGTLSSIFVPS